MSSKCHSLHADDSLSLKKGDLGFGLGLRPGAVSTGNVEESKTSFTTFFDQEQKDIRQLNCSSCSSLPSSNERRKFDAVDNSHRSFPTFAGVQYGTSLRQQRELFESTRQGLCCKKEVNDISSFEKDGSIHQKLQEERELQGQLYLATEGVTVLESELEVCRRQLDSKYRAIRILQNQASIVTSHYMKNEENITQLKKKLEKEVNALQFELHVKTSSLSLSEETWAERFDRVCIENATLMATLQARSNEVRRLHTEKIALIRERDELLAKMDANERLHYEMHWSTKNDEAYLQNSLSEQLAVLGACLCRGSKPEPCQCARIAAILTKESNALKDDVALLKQKLGESLLVSDSFRKAFDEQLQKNRVLMKHLSSHGNQQSNNKKPFWKKKISNEVPSFSTTPVQVQYSLSSLPVTKYFEKVSHPSSNQRSVGVQVNQPIPDPSGILEDLLNDKCEALVHQRLVTRLLAQRTQDLENSMKKVDTLMKYK